MEESKIRAGLIQHWRFEGIDYDKSHEIYHDDAILEFPQSGERFVGKDNFLTWRKKYPAKLDFRIRRISHSGDLWVNGPYHRVSRSSQPGSEALSHPSR